MIEPLQSLRFVLALLIFLFHFPGCNIVSPQVCDMSVAVFMLLSGFVMTLSTRRKPLPPYGSYISARLQRIWPLNVLCLSGMMILWDLTPEVVFTSFFMVQAWVPEPSIYFGGNGVAWFLNDLFLFYLLFPPLLRFMQGKPKQAAACLVGIALIYFLWVICLCPAERTQAFIYIAPWVRIVDFIIGMAAAKIFISLPKISVRTALSAQCGALVIFAICVAFAPLVTERLTLASWWWIPGSLLIIALSLRGTVIYRLLSWRPLTWLGDISFGIYMTHLLIIITGNIIAGKLVPGLNTWIILAADLAATIGVSAVLHRFKLC